MVPPRLSHLLGWSPLLTRLELRSHTAPPCPPAPARPTLSLAGCAQLHHLVLSHCQAPGRERMSVDIQGVQALTNLTQLTLR